MSSASHAKLFASLLGDAGTATPAEVAGRAGVSPEAAAETLTALAREGLLEQMPGGGYRAGAARLARGARALPGRAGARGGRRPRRAALRRGRDRSACARPTRRSRQRATPRPARAPTTCFHQRLTEGCGNQRLLDVVRPLRQALMAYERVYFSTRGAARRARPRSTRRSSTRWRAGDQERAAALVRENFTTALPELTAELDERSRER